MRVLLVEHLLSAEQTWSEGPERERAGLPSPSSGELGFPALLCLSLEPPPAAPQEGPAQLKGRCGGVLRVPGSQQKDGAPRPSPSGLALVWVLSMTSGSSSLPLPDTGWKPAPWCWDAKQGIGWGLSTPCLRSAQLPRVPALVGGWPGGWSGCCPAGAGRETPDCCSKQAE